MGNLIKRIAGSAPIWAWIVMVVCVIILVVGLIISSNRTAPETSASSVPTPASSNVTADPATTTFVEEAKANPSQPKTLVLLGDSTGAARDGWAPALGSAISSNLDRPVATRFWSVSGSNYGPMVGLGDGDNGPVGFWNASASGRDVEYTIANLSRMIQPDVTPDLILLNFGATEEADEPLAPQLTPLITQLKQKYPNADIVAIKQSPRRGADTSAQQTGFASAMDAEGVQVIDVNAAFPTDQAALAALLTDSVNPNAEGQKLWTQTVTKAFGLTA